jgi:manganese/zinc/iron transport system ATP- binding protein
VDWNFPISVLDVVLMGRSLRRPRFRLLSATDRAAALQALETVAMQRFAHVQIGALSGGQQQRVFLARALVQDAEVYLLDEPFTGVDVPSQSLILDVLRQLCETGKTVIFATHDLAMAAESADNCLLLNRSVVASGPPRDVLTAGNLQATFGGAALIPLAGVSRP